MFIIYCMIGAQFIAWGWFSLKDGKLKDNQFYIFTVGMLLGQIAASFETFLSEAWGTFAIQLYFFVFTAYAGIKRFWDAKKGGES